MKSTEASKASKASKVSDEQIVVSRAEYESLLAAKDTLLATNASLAQAVKNLEEQLRLAHRQRFGTKSEKSKYDDGLEQLTMEMLFNEVEFYADNTESTETAEPELTVGRAVAYTLEQWPWLCNYLLDGRLELSNNLAERSIKPFVIGRKNFLFANAPGGARDSAILYSLVETAKAAGLDPYRYLVGVME